MRIRFLLLYLAILLSSFSLIASEISKIQAKTVAVNFFTETLLKSGQDWKTDSLKVKNIFHVEKAYFIVNFNEGWVVVSADDVTNPIIGYNYQNEIEYPFAANSNYANYMQHFIDQIKFVRENDIQSNLIVEQKWNHYLKNDFQPLINIVKRNSHVDPLITSKWDQDFPYNYYCPTDDNGPGGHALVGCVATAMAQIMYYWRYPLRGSGSHSYYIYPYGTQSVDYGNAYYYYNAMQDEADINYPYSVAKLSYHAAVSVDMDFDPEGSGAYSEDVPYAMETYFNYHLDCRHEKKVDYSQAIWEEMIQSELDQYRPIYYAGRNSDNSGHAFVCDGYNEEGFYHFNFGWNGTGNGYYALDDVNNFHYYQTMVYMIYPNDGAYPYIANGTTNLTTISGSFTDGSGPYDYIPGINAKWLISPQTETDSVVNIKLIFKEIGLNELDEIKVYDGPTEETESVAIFNGDTVPPSIYSSGNEVLITFSSDHSGEGFIAEFESILPSFCSAIETISDSAGFISDGSDKFNYRNNTSCLFKFSQEDNVHYSFEIIDFDTEKNKDKITFYNKNQDVLGELSGQLTDEVLHIQSDEVYLMWTTNSEITKKGWKLKYTINEINSIYELKLTSLSIFPNPTNSSLNVSFETEKSESLKVQLTNLSGQVLQSEVLKNGFSGRYSHSFNLSDYPKGVYILSIISEKGKVDKKVVLK